MEGYGILHQVLPGTLEVAPNKARDLLHRKQQALKKLLISSRARWSRCAADGNAHTPTPGSWRRSDVLRALGWSVFLHGFLPGLAAHGNARTPTLGSRRRSVVLRVSDRNAFCMEDIALTFDTEK